MIRLTAFSLQSLRSYSEYFLLTFESCDATGGKLADGHNFFVSAVVLAEVSFPFSNMVTDFLQIPCFRLFVFDMHERVLMHPWGLLVCLESDLVEKINYLENSCFCDVIIFPSADSISKT